MSLASPETFGHTGFTGTCVWVDPKYNLIFIFLSNRVNPTSENGKISSLNVRSGIMETIYKAWEWMMNKKNELGFSKIQYHLTIIIRLLHRIIVINARQKHIYPNFGKIFK